MTPPHQHHAGNNPVTPGPPDRPACLSRQHVHGRATPPPRALGLGVCAGCRDRLEEDLVELPGWYDHCASVLDPRRPRFEERVKGSRPRGIVLRDAVVTLRSDILGVLASWCGLVVSERGVSGPEELSIRKLVTFLAVHLNWLVAHPAAADLVDEVAGLVRSARQVEPPDDEIVVEFGGCARPGCGERVRAESRTGDLRAGRVACAAGHAVRPEEWLMLHGRHPAGRRELGPPTTSSEME